MQELSFSGRVLWAKKLRLRKPKELPWVHVTLLQHKFLVWDGAAPIVPARQDRGREEELPLKAAALSPGQGSHGEVSAVLLCLIFRSLSLTKNQYGQKEAGGHLSLCLHGLVRAEAEPKHKNWTNLGSPSACTGQGIL